MANLGVYRFESDERRQKWLKAYGYKTNKSYLVNVFLSADNHEQKPFIVQCVLETQMINSGSREIDINI